MPEPSLTSRERALLERLVPLVTHRAERDSDLSCQLQDRTQAADRDCQGRLRAAESLANTEIRAAEQERDDKVSALKEAFDQELHGAQAAMNAELSAFAERTQSIENAAQQDHEDAAWLAETVVESSERKLKTEYTNVAKALATFTGEIDQVRQEADALLKKYKHAPLVEPSEPPVLSGPSRQACEAARADVLKRFATLEGRVRPALLRVSWLMILVLVGSAAGAAVGGLAIVPMEIDNIMKGAGGGAIAAAVFLILLQFVMRRRVAPASRALGESIAKAAAVGAKWLEESEGERDRQAAFIREKRDAELRKARDRFTAIKQELHRRRHEEEPAIRQRHEGLLSSIRRRYESAVRSADDERRRRVEGAHAKREAEFNRANTLKQESVTSARAEESSGRAELAREWQEGAAFAIGERDAVVDGVLRHCPAWDDPVWQAYRPSTLVPQAVRFGEVTIDASAIKGGLEAGVPHAGEFLPLRLPLLLDLHDKGSLLFQSGPEGRDLAQRTVANILLRLLTAFPPGKVRFTFVDPVGLGQSFAGFMHLADYEEAIVGDKIWTDAKRIEQKLVDLTDHMENVIQKYLRNEFATIHDYNQQAGEVAEPFRFLVLADFPAGLSEHAAKRLASIVSSGPRCGVYTIIVADSRQRPPHWLPIQDIESASVVLSHQKGQFTCKEAHLARWPVSLDAPPGEEQFNTLIHAIGRFAKDSSKVQVPFEIVVPPAGQNWSGDCSDELVVPLGRAGANKLQYMTLGRGTSQHVLIAGRTGSGKSTLLHAIVTNLALWYRPEEVEFYLVDFKKGVEFKTYATHRVPHARVVAVESEREFGLSVLRRLDAELTRRGNLFRDAGVQDLGSYRRWARGAGMGLGPTVMPRTLLIVDEFQEFFVEDDKIAQEAALLMDRLVRQGRAFGIHVILGSQTVGGAYSLARSTIGQMAIRVALQCSEADSYLIMSEDNNAPRLLSRPGEAIYNDASGMVEGNSPFQIVWLSEEKREKYLRDVQKLAEALPSGLPPAPIVFEGNVPSELSENSHLAALLEGAAATPSVLRAYLGEPISIKDPTAVSFRKQSGSNVLVVGQQEYAAQAIEISCVLSLLAHDPRCAVDILNAPGSDDGTPDSLALLAEGLAQAVTIHAPRDVEALVADVSADLDRRRADEHAEHPRRFVIVHGLQRHRALRRSEEDFGFGGESDKPQRPDQQFVRILREGPPVGIHVIAWCDTVGNLERTLDRRAIREFDYRAPFQMSANDSTALIDSPQAVNLGRHRALLFSEELGQAEKFRPYSVPTPTWIEGAMARLLPRVRQARA